MKNSLDFLGLVLLETGNGTRQYVNLENLSVAHQNRDCLTLFFIDGKQTEVRNPKMVKQLSKLLNTMTSEHITDGS